MTVCPPLPGSDRRLRVAVAGKGGAGKSTLAGTLARVLARRGHRVLALDSDTLPGLALSLGATAPAEPPLLAAAEKGEDGRWRLKKGIGPARAVQRYAIDAPDGVRLLQSGKHTDTGLAPVMGAVNVFYKLVARLNEPAGLREWTFVGDLSAGPRQIAYDWAPYAERILLVVEPTWQSMLTARRIVRIAATPRAVAMSLVVNKASGQPDVELVEDFFGMSALAVVPADDALRDAERSGLAPIDMAPHSPAVAAIEQLADALAAGSLQA